MTDAIPKDLSSNLPTLNCLNQLLNFHRVLKAYCLTSEARVLHSVGPQRENYDIGGGSLAATSTSMNNNPQHSNLPPAQPSGFQPKQPKTPITHNPEFSPPMDFGDGDFYD